MDILDVLLDDDEAPAAKAAEAPADDPEADVDLLLQDFSTGDVATKKAALKALVALFK